MILVLISIFLIILGCVCLAIRVKNSSYQDRIEGIGVASIDLGAMFTMACLIIFLSNNICVNKRIYESKLERESIIKQIECVNGDYENVSRTIVIEKVYEWNKKVYKQKYYSKNPWTNWFNNKSYTDSLEYIDLED